MALRNILKDNDPGLLKKSRTVTDFNQRLHILLDDMHETLEVAKGLGIAAPQVGVLRRAAIVVDTVSESESDNDRIIELINPEIIYKEGEQSGSEGCLSLPGLYGMVSRPQTIKVRAHDRFGNEFTMDASDMTARAICHETDHLEGVIFTSIAERMLTEEEVDQLRNEQDETETHEGPEDA